MILCEVAATHDWFEPRISSKEFTDYIELFDLIFGFPSMQCYAMYNIIVKSFLLDLCCHYLTLEKFRYDLQ